MQVFILKSFGNFMKKISLLLVFVIMLTAFVGCADNTDSETTTQPVSETQENIVTVSVNKDLVADETEFLTGISEIDGITSTADANFYVLKMSQETYAELLDVKKKVVIDEFEKISSEISYIEKIDYNEHFREINIYVDRQGYDAADYNARQLNVLTIGATAMGKYQMFLTKGQKTFVKVLYSDTGETAYTMQLPIQM